METKRLRGWHAQKKRAPHRGKGSATPDPIRELKDVEQIRKHLQNDPRDLALFNFAVTTGFRASDYLGRSNDPERWPGVLWRDVLTPLGRIRADVTLHEGKTRKSRTTPITTKCASSLARWLQTRGGVDAIDLDGPVFTSKKNGQRITIQRLHQLVRAWTKAARLDGRYSSHSLRKCFGVMNASGKNGLSIEELMTSFNHSSEKTTLRYLGIQAKVIGDKIRAKDF